MQKILLLILLVQLLLNPAAAYSQDLNDPGAPSDILNQVPDRIRTNAPQLSVFERVTLCEINVFGSNSPKKELPDRIVSIETHLFGKQFVSQQPAIVSRINNILFNARLPNQLVADAVADAVSKPDWASRKAFTHIWLGTALQRVQLLETELGTKLHKDKLLVERIAALEKSALGKEADSGAIDQRIEQLEHTIVTNSANWKNSGSNNSARIISSIGRGLKKAGKSTLSTTSESTKTVLKSPTFWMLLIGAGALTGLYFATRNSSGSSTFNSYPDPVYGCHGDVPCKICVDCSRCVHCNSGRSRCLPDRNR